MFLFMFAPIHLQYLPIMTKKFLLASLLCSTLLTNAAHSQEFVADTLLMAMSVPSAQQDGRNQDAQSSGSSGYNAVTLDRSGMDKASVHLQILQQTNSHFSETAQAKKPAAEDKKLPVKPQGNS
jgi:hypothetical protein